MGKFTLTKRADVPAGRLWEILSDFGNIHLFNPNVRASSVRGAKERGVGAVRRCDLYGKGHLIEEITRWTEGEGFSLEIIDGTAPLKHAEVTFEVRPLGEASSSVSLTMDYTVKMGPLGWLLDRLMVGRMLRGALGGLLDGLDHYARTGEPVGENGVPQGPAKDSRHGEVALAG